MPYTYIIQVKAYHGGWIDEAVTDNETLAHKWLQETVNDERDPSKVRLLEVSQTITAEPTRLDPDCYGSAYPGTYNVAPLRAR